MQACERNRKSGQPARRFFASSQGASSIEQAIFIALVVAAALAGIEGLGLMSHTTFDHVARGLGEQEGEGPRRSGGAARSPASAEVRASSLRNLLEPQTLRFIVLLAACPVAAICWYCLYRDTRRQRAEATEKQSEQHAPTNDQDTVFAKRHELLRTFTGDVGMLFTSRMLIHQVMTRNVLRVQPCTPIAEVRWEMAQRKVRHLLVCDKQERLLGVISDRDVHNASAKTARDVMSGEPVSVAPDCLVNTAVTLLLQRRISCLPVVENQRVVGVVTSTDLLMALQCTLHALQRVALEAVADLPPDTVPGFMLAAQAEFQSLQASESTMAARS